MSQIPREWTFAVRSAGAAQSIITVPAAASGLRHVLTSIKAQIRGVGGAVGIYTTILEVRDGGGAGTLLFEWVMDVDTAVVAAQSEFDEPLIRMGSPNTQLTVRFSNLSAASVGQQISITGYDV